MKHDFDAYDDSEDCSEAFIMCLDKSIYDYFHASCPINIKTISSKQTKKPPWITQEILSQIRLRNSYSVLWKSNRLATGFYKRHYNYVTNTIRSAKRQY